MRLFISYSRDNKEWTYELWRALRDRARHDPWIDLDIKGAADWWESILEAIENADCVLYILTPKSVESIYCRAEIAYALALNKPILPLMLRTAALPSELSARRIQYETLTDQMALHDVLLVISNSLMRVVQDKSAGKYAPNAASRPDVPKPAADNPDHLFEVFALAEESASEGDLTKAQTLFNQVIEIDPDGLGAAAHERLTEIIFERDRAIAYKNIARLAVNPATLKGAQAAWRAFIQKYGADYDPPDGLNPPSPIQSVISPPPPPAAAPAFSPPRLQGANAAGGGVLLPPPFGWCPIPAGKVTLGGNAGANGGYIKKATVFDVPAFSIAKYPVTNAQYQVFVDAPDGYADTRWWDYSKDAANWRKSNTQPEDTAFAGDDLPRTNVSWYDSVAFCRWLTVRLNDSPRPNADAEGLGVRVTLPTEQQWQRAAQGDDGRVYPWGKQWDCQRCNNSVKPCDSNATTPVIHYEGKDKGDSPYGVVDMSGNVWEWCLTEYESGSSDINGTNERMLRGGSWDHYVSGNFRVDYRNWLVPSYWFNYWGFRLALS